MRLLLTVFLAVFLDIGSGLKDKAKINRKVA
jgi:hypothetical protein